jgi:hypothetical protein
MVARLLGYSTASELDRFFGFTGVSWDLESITSEVGSLSGEGDITLLFLRPLLGWKSSDDEESLEDRR